MFKQGYFTNNHDEQSHYSNNKFDCDIRSGHVWKTIGKSVNTRQSSLSSCTLDHLAFNPNQSYVTKETIS